LTRKWLTALRFIEFGIFRSPGWAFGIGDAGMCPFCKGAEKLINPLESGKEAEECGN
jgi:hypothetical protein